MKYLANIIWACIEKAFFLGCGVLVSALVARTLGPSELGKITFGLTLGVLLTSISQWGSNHTVFNLAVRCPKRALVYLESSAPFRFFVYLFLWLLIVLCLILVPKYSDALLVISFAALSSVFLGADAYQHYFMGTLKAGNNAKSSMLSSVLGMLYRLYLLASNGNTLSYVLPYFLSNSLIYYTRRRLALGLWLKPKRAFRLKFPKRFFSDGLPFVSTALATFIYTKAIDVLLVQINGYEDVAIYSVSVVLGYSWSFLPVSIGITLSVDVLKKRTSKEHGLASILASMILISMPFVILLSVLSAEVVQLVYGNAYITASAILPIVCWTTVFSSINLVSNRFIGATNGGGRFLVKKLFFSALISVPLGALLIENYGVLGAAYAVLIVELIGATVLNYIYAGFDFRRTHSRIPISLLTLGRFVKTLER